MARDEEDRKALGQRLATARKLASLTLVDVAAHLTENGYQYGKQAISAWETGRNVPDSLVLRRLAKLYGTTVDALLWDDSLTMEAVQMAAWFDSLSEEQRRTYRAVILAFVENASANGDTLPMAPISVGEPNPAESMVGGDSGFAELEAAHKKAAAKRAKK